MKFEMNHQVGTDYSTVRFKPHAVKGFALLAIVESFQKLGGEMIDTASNWKFPKHITSEVLQEVIHNTCFICGGLMKDDTKEVETQEGKRTDIYFVKTRKCNTCGHSHT